MLLSLLFSTKVTIGDNKVCQCRQLNRTYMRRSTETPIWLIEDLKMVFKTNPLKFNVKFKDSHCCDDDWKFNCFCSAWVFYDLFAGLVALFIEYDAFGKWLNSGKLGSVQLKPFQYQLRYKWLLLENTYSTNFVARNRQAATFLLVSGEY